ncbi:MAG: beta-lactamase family protein [Chloroflexi bacterium]|nr:beta-lactamase family protein [Chloroflexota bacterium]
MTTAIKIHGTCDSRFSAVKEAFAENFARGSEVGAAVAVYLDGRPVVDVWAGYSNAARTKPWERDTIVNTMSVTKGMTAICAHRLVEQGKLDLDAPVASYWPEFTQAGKEKIPVRYLLNHRAGLPAVRKPLPPEALFDWDAMTQALAAQDPWWEPGTKLGYHVYTFGWLVGELVRRISGSSLGTFFRREVAEPLGVDFHIGLDTRDDPRVAECIIPRPPDTPNPMAELLRDPESITSKAINNPPREPDVVNSLDWRRAEIPSANGHGNARAVARVYGALAMGGEMDSVRLLSPEVIERAIIEEYCGPDAVYPRLTRVGLGFWLNCSSAPLGPNPRSFGHPGAGGSLGFADPDARIGFGYVINKFWRIPPDPRHRLLIEAVYGSL